MILLYWWCSGNLQESVPTTIAKQGARVSDAGYWVGIQVTLGLPPAGIFWQPAGGSPWLNSLPSLLSSFVSRSTRRTSALPAPQPWSWGPRSPVPLPVGGAQKQGHACLLVRREPSPSLGPQRPHWFVLWGLSSPGWRRVRLVCKGWGEV